jgi:hypothetical protein
MICAHCGQSLPEEAAFCNKCGQRVQPPAAGEMAPFLTTMIPPPQPLERTESAPTVTTTQPPLSSTTGFFPQTGDVIPPPPPPTSLVQLSGFQRWLIRIFGGPLAGNPLFGVLFGGVLALVLAWLLSLAAVGGIEVLAASLPADQRDTFKQAILIFPVASSIWKKSLGLLITSFGPALHLNQPGSGSFAAVVAPVFSGFLLLPALCLLLGGYIAAISNFKSSLPGSLLRGLSICLPVTVGLLLISVFLRGPIEISGQASINFAFDTPSLLLLGLLWSALFGTLGAMIRVRSQLGAFFLQLVRSALGRFMLAPLCGALVALGLGLALSLLCVYCFLAFSSVSVPWMTTNGLLPMSNWQYLLVYSIDSSPLLSFNFFCYSMGGSLQLHYDGIASHIPSSIFAEGISPWVYLIVLIPLVSVFVGGRVSAAIGRGSLPGPGLLWGMAIVVPLLILLLLLSPLMSYGLQVTTTQLNSGSQDLVAGIDRLHLFAAPLLFTLVIGGLGGLYQTLLTRRQARRAQPTSAARSSLARRWLIAACGVALVLLLLAIAGSTFLVVYPHILPAHSVYLIRDSGASALLGLPDLLLIAAGLGALKDSARSLQQTNMSLSSEPALP